MKHAHIVLLHSCGVITIHGTADTLEKETQEMGGKESRPEGARTKPTISCGKPPIKAKQIENGSLAFLDGEEELSWPVQKPDQKLS